MPSSQAASHSRNAVKLAILDTLTVGIALGYLAHQNREALVSHSATIGLATLILVAAAAALRVVIRTLSHTDTRIEAIFADELREQPDERES
jgi:energy-converting hydrogenase Eha subunit E